MKEKKYYRFSVVCEIVTLIFTVVTVICTVANVRMTRDANQREKAMAEAMLNVKGVYEENILSGVEIENAGANLESIECTIYPFLRIQYLDQYSETQDRILKIPDAVLKLVSSSTTTGVIKEYKNSTQMENLSSTLKTLKDYKLDDNKEIKSISIMYFINSSYTDVIGMENEEQFLCVTGLGDGRAEKAEIIDYSSGKFDSDQKKWYAKLSTDEAYEYTMNLDSNNPADVSSAIEATVNYDGAAFLVDMKVKQFGTDKWYEGISAKQGDTVRYRIHVKNVSTEVLENICVRDIVPNGMSYVPGSVTLVNLKHPNGIAISDNLFEDTGANVGAYNPNGGLYIYFNAEIGAIESQNNIILRNIIQVSAGSKTGTQEDTADVYIEGNID